MLFAIAFIAIILSAGGVRRQLSLSVKEKVEKEDVKDNLSYLQELSAFLWKYRLQTGITTLVVIIA